MQDKRWLCKNGCFDCDGRDNNCENYTEEEIIINTNNNEFTGNISNLGRIKDEFGIENKIIFTGENNGPRKKKESKGWNGSWKAGKSYNQKGKQYFKKCATRITTSMMNTAKRYKTVFLMKYKTSSTVKSSWIT